MAKSARSSATKGNRKALRARVFGPVDEARNQRLSAKLLEIAAQPKPERSEEMHIDTPVSVKKTQVKDAMDVDDESAAPASKASSSKSKKTHRIHKRGRKKPANQISFPKSKKGRRVDTMKAHR